MRLDKESRDVIVHAIKQATIEQSEIYGERWVSGDELSTHISIFSKSWLKKYGKSIPRKEAEMQDSEGNIRKMNYTYPLHKILRMMADGEFDVIKVDRLRG